MIGRTPCRALNKRKKKRIVGEGGFICSKKNLGCKSVCGGQDNGDGEGEAN